MDKRLYRKLRADGCKAEQALRAARIAEAWGELEDRGLVRIYAEPDDYVSLEDYEACDREAIREQIEKDGAWTVVTEYRRGDEWEMADCISQCIGYSNVLDPAENYYVTDLEEEAIDAARKVIEAPRCPTCGQRTLPAVEEK